MKLTKNDMKVLTNHKLRYKIKINIFALFSQECQGSVNLNNAY